MYSASSPGPSPMWYCRYPVGIVLIGIASLAITWLRRQRGRRRLAARISARLDAIAAPRKAVTVAVEASRGTVERAGPPS